MTMTTAGCNHNNIIDSICSICFTFTRVYAERLGGGGGGRISFLSHPTRT